MDDQVILRVAHIVKTIGGNRILDDVSLSVQKGRLKVLIGPSGSGKSTLLSCINFLSPPDSGEIALDGKVVNGKSKRELLALRQQVGMSRRLFLLSQALLLAVFLLAPGQGIAQAKSAQPKIEIYVTSWCPYCKKAVAYFQAKGLPFTIHDIESNPGAAKRFEQFHGSPLLPEATRPPAFPRPRLSRILQ